MVALRVVVVTLALFALSVHCTSVTFNDMTSPDPNLANIAAKWTQGGTCWTQTGGGASFATAAAGCQGQSFGNAYIKYLTAVSSVSSGTPATTGYVCTKFTIGSALIAADIVSVGDAGGSTANFALPIGTTGTTVVGAQYGTLPTTTFIPLVSLNSPAGNTGITTVLNEVRVTAVLTQYKAFTNNPTFVAGGTKSSVGGFQFDGGQTPVSDSITPGGTAQAVTGSFTGSTTTTPITYGFTPNANWAALSDGQTYSLKLTDSAVYQPPASAGAACTAGAQTLTATVVVNVVMVTAITSTTNNADLFGSDSVLVEKFGGTGSYGVTATASTDTTKCSWTDTTPATKTATGATFTTNTVSANGGTLTVTCPGTGAGSGVTFTTFYPVKIVQMGVISVPTGGGYASAGNKLVTGTGSNPTISITQLLDTSQITYTTTSGGTFVTNPGFSTVVNGLGPTDNAKSITATAQFKGATSGTVLTTVTDQVILTIVYVSISTFTAPSQQTANCPGGYASPCVVASATTPSVTFTTAGTGFDTQGILINGALTAGGTGTAGGSTQSITFAVGQDKATVASRVANSAAAAFLIDSNGGGSTATNKQLTLAFLSVSAGTAGLKATSPNSNAAGTSCVMSPAMTSNTCTFQVGGTAFNTVDVVETGGASLSKTGYTVAPGGSITSNTGAPSDDGSTVVIKASITGVAGYVETSAQSISIYYLSVSAFQTKVTPTAVPNAGINYVYFASNANTLSLSTVGTGFDTVVYNGFSGGAVTDTTVTVAGAAPSRTVTSGPKSYTVVLADDNKAISLVISDAAVSAATTYSVPAATFGITLIYTQVKPGVGNGNGLFFTGAAASNAGTYPTAQACVATAAMGSNTCTFTVAGNSFNGYTYKTSNGGSVTGSSNGAAAPTIGATTITSITTPALSTGEDGATLTATVFEAGSAAYTTRPTDTTSAAPLYFLSVSTFETNTVPTAFKNAGNYYVVLNSATTLKLQTIGTGFNTVSYTANLGTLKTAQGSSAGNTAGTDATWLTGASPNRVATQPQLTITGLTAADNTAVVSTTVSNKAVSSIVTYTPANALNIVYLSQTTFSVTAAPATVGATCYATPASTCTFTLTGTGFDTFDYTSSAAGTGAKATNQAAAIAGSPPVSTAAWTPALTYKDTTANAGMPITMGYTAYYTAQPATRLTITGSLPLIFVSDIEFATGNKYTPVTNSQAAPNTLNLFAAGDNTATSPNPKISGKGTGFTNAKVQRKNGAMFVDVPGTYLACTVGNGGTSTATYDCPLIPNGQTGFLPADDQAQFQVVLWNSGNTGVTYTTSPITVTVFGFKTDPPVSLVGFTTVRTPPYNPPTTNVVSYTYALVDANGVPAAPGNNVPQTQTWSTFAGDAVRDPVMPATATALTANSIITFLVSANAALSSTHNAPWTAGGPFVGKNADSYKITLTLSGVSTFRQTSFQLVTFSYFSGSGTQPNANGDYLYDYYAGYTGPKAANPPNYVPPNPEPAYSINVKADHLAPLDKTGTIKVAYTNQCTLTVTPGTGGLVGPTLTSGPQTNVDVIQFLVDCTQSTDPSQPNCVYNQVEKLNGATLQVTCTGDAVYTSTSPSPYGPSVPLVIKYPAKMGLLPTNTWTSTPAGFCSGYAGQYPEPGHWDYDQPLTVNFNWAKLGNPAVTAIQQVMTWDIRTVSSSGTPLAIASSGGFPGAPTVLNGANPIAYQISNGVALTIAQARDIYFNNYLTVTAKFTGTGGTPLLTPFTITFQPLDVSIDNGILQPHFPPVLATTPALLAPQFNNFADVGGFVWQPPPLGFIVKHGFPKHDSPFGNSKYTTVAIPVFPNRNYDQILETRVTVAFGQPTPTSPTTYDNKYQYFTSVAANLINAPTTKSFTEPKAGVVSNAYTNGIPGVYAVTSTITPTGPLWTYNKWIYRWILGVYKVSGQYEPYVVPTVNVFDPTALTYKYHTASSGFEGVWNWYPREFTPSSCPSVPTGNPFDIGTTDALVVPTTTASMYPSPDAGVLSWAYSHQTAGPSFRIDSTLASGILSGAQNSNTALLPSVSTVVHTFNSQYTVTIQQASATADAFGPQTTENLGYTVTASGKISSIVSADANSIITARYSHTLPFYLLLAPDGNPTTSGQRTLVGYPTVVTVNNCKVITTLANNTPFTVNSHRAGETFVLSLSSVTVGGTFSVTIVDATPGTMDTAQTVISQTVIAGTTPVFRFTAGYNLAGSALTKSTIKYSGITGTVNLSYHEFSSIPANWPFANDPTGAVIGGAYANNEAVKTCVGQKVSASSVSGTTAPGFGVPKTAQYFGCGTANQVTPPTC